MSGRESPPPADPKKPAGSAGSYRVSELVGCEVVTRDGERLGCLEDVLPTGGNDVFVVRDGARECLIPALQSVVVEMDLKKRRLTVELPAGWREIYLP